MRFVCLKFISTLLKLLPIFVFKISFSQVEKTEQKDIKIVSSKEILYQDNIGFVTFLGPHIGYSVLNEDNTNIRKNKSGYLIGGDFLASWYPSAWVLDVGLGWQYSQVRGQDKETESSPEFTGVRMETQAPLAQLGVLYRLTEQFQLGLNAKMLFGTDVGFDSVESSSSPSFFAGAQMAYGVPQKLGDTRFFISVLMSLNLVEKTNYQASAGLLFGVPWIKPDTLYKEKNMLGIRKNTEEVETRVFVPKIQIKQVVRFAFSNNEIIFKNKRALLGVENQRFLFELSLVLQEAKQHWQELILEAYVPLNETATNEEATKLSQARAAAVKNALVSAGLQTEFIKSRASILNKKTTPAGFQSENPYLEMVFSGVTNEPALNDALIKFKNRFKRPETCKNDQECK
jgi:hypothetical protein